MKAVGSYVVVIATIVFLFAAALDSFMGTISAQINAALTR